MKIQPSYLVTFVSLVLVLLGSSGYFTSLDLFEHWHSVTNPAMAMGALWILAIIVYTNIKKNRQLVEKDRLLLKEEKYFQLLVDGIANYAIYIMDTEGRLKSWNSGAERLKLYTADEVIGKHFSMFYTQEDIANGLPEQALEIAKKSGKFITDGWRLRKDGTRFWANLTIDALHGQDGDVIGFVKLTHDITEQRNIEQALQQEKKNLETILNTAVDCIITITSEGIIESFNPAAEAIFGYRSGEVIGKNVSILIPEPDKSMHNGYLQHYLTTGKKKVIGTGGREIQAQRKDGTIFPAILGVGTFDIEGERKFVGSVRDITAYKEAEERYTLAVKGAAVGLWDWNIKTNVLFWSDTYKRIIGITDNAFTPEFNEFENRLHPEDRDAILKILTSHLEHQTPYDVECQLKRDDETYVWVHIKGQALWDEMGKPIRMAGSAEDITRRKEIEAKLERKRKEFLNLALSGSNLSVWEWNIRSGKLNIDDRLAIILGYDNNEMSSGIDNVKNLINPDDWAEYAKTLEKDSDEHPFVCEAELRMLAKNGEWYWILSRGNIVEYDAEGKPLRAAGTYHDVTKRKNMEEELYRLYEELLHAKEAAEKAKFTAENASRAKSDFLSNMSHEIRTPMNAIVGVSNLLRGMRLTTQQRHYAEIAATSANTLLQIIDDVLDLSKIEAGKLLLEEVPFNLKSICEEMAKLLAIKAREKHLEFLLRYEPSCPDFLIGDPVRIRQVILNLCSNAIKFTEKGHILLDISHENAADGQAILRIAVIDTGVGIPEEKMGTIFGMFEQVDNSTTRKYGGTGIGLSVSMQLVQLMYGAIGVESNEGKGSTFWFRIVLPRAEQETPSVLPDIPHIKGTRVLIVDDNNISCEIICDQLAPFGLEISVASNGAEAIEMLKKASENGTPYECAIIDYVMPGMDGLQVMKNIRKHPMLNDLLGILISSQAIPGDVSAVRQYGYNGYLDKPLHQNYTASMIASLLEAKKEGTDAGFLTSFSMHPPANENQKKETPYFQGVRILIVEDNWANQEVMRAMLASYGIQSMVASDGREAITHIKNYLFDLVLMDCQMPEMDGFEATAEIRRMESEQGIEHITIIALTANAMKADKDHCLEAGMDDYLSKPINSDDFENSLQKWLPAEKRVQKPGLDDPQEENNEANVQKNEEGVAQHAFNLVQLDKMRHILKERFPEVINGYLEDAEQYITLIKEGLTSQNMDQVAKNAHPLKSSSAGFGLMSVSQLASTLEKNAKEALAQHNAREALAPLLSQLEEAFAFTSQKLKNFLNKVA